MTSQTSGASRAGHFRIAVHALQGTVAAVLVILALNAMKAIERTRGESRPAWTGPRGPGGLQTRFRDAIVDTLW